jgi:crotonobetainyl-CoA:carnitine CoA-transferase CaiB-like acyl-CoA transferase
MWVLAPDVIASRLLEPGQGMPAFGRSSAPNPLGNSYQTKEGRWLLLMMLQPDRYWRDFCEHIDRPALADDPRFVDGRKRFENRSACIALLDEVFAERTLPEWIARFATLAGQWAPMQSAAELHDDPQSLANGYLPETEAAGRRVRLVANPVQFDETPLGELPPSPEMGQHTEEVLLELGVAWDEIARCKEAGAIN